MEIRAKDGSHVGMAVLVTPKHLVTAAHVVNVALERDRDSKEQPLADAGLVVAFPLLPDGVIADGHVIEWRPMGVSPQDDIAVVELTDSAPAEAGLARLADVTGIGMDDDSLSVFGIEDGDVMGNHASARFRGFNTDAWIQVEGDRGDDVFAPRGFSGGAVWDNQHAVSIGMLVRRAKDDTDSFAYMIPAADIAAFWPDLPIERRPLSSSFMRGFTVLSAVFFALILIHWQADRGTDLFRALSVGANKLLSSFFGMQIFAVLAPILFYMLLTFARSRNLHPWWQRVPSFGAMGRLPVGSSTRRTATLTLAMLVLLPILAQGHFLKKFGNEGEVYFYKSDFPHIQSTPVECTTTRNRTMPVCLHKGGRMRLATDPDGSWGPLFDNNYHYGNLLSSDNDRASVTFFPILQPVAVYALTALALYFAAQVVLAVFFVSRNRNGPTH
ncbi:trypsin-like peptidase domain-containing protein [Mesorhizobium amorphae]|uniref:trypsin-like peptidase domain-containing protein n=1 Tax=Mesorhizobium amorphae TaxID=71433 RepID=UPI00177DE616